ncbi:MAG TPA: hypothetical protein VGO58_19320 [Chitinophagaceae bacterium]|jgi:hypothetical protein|nr:hypothetical protein [Chitinophagaceae bacterium]
MEQAKKYRGFWWLLFVASTALLVFMICTHNPWLTLTLPAVTTSFVKGMDIM